ncbi:MAG: hypothetical protein M5U01_10425 [Ardenticatenaceae bacterium]|nr:hypothetical protein [Ardenticatenaceae bacterium]
MDRAKLEAGVRAATVPWRERKPALKTEAPHKWRQYLLGGWRRRANTPEVAALDASKLRIAEQLVDEWVKAHPTVTLPVAFDSWDTHPAFWRYLDETLHRPSVGTRTDDHELDLATGRQRLEDFAQHLTQEHPDARKTGGAPVFRSIRIASQGEEEHYYSYCAPHKIHNFGRHRVVINHRRADLTDSPGYSRCNRLNWHASGITPIRRHRWPVAVYHEEGKAEGLDQDQIRDVAAIERQVACVAGVSS